MLCDDIWIRAVFIMNIHNAVAMRSDVAHLRDGTSCLREVVEGLKKGSLSQSAQKALKRKLQVLVDAQTAIANDLHSQVSGVIGTGGSHYVAKRLATEHKYSALSLPSQSDHWQRMKDLAQSDKENRIDMPQTPVRSRLPTSAPSSTSKQKEVPVPDDIFCPPPGTQYTPEQAITTLAEVPRNWRTKTIQSWIHCKAIPVKDTRNVLKRLQAYQGRGGPVCAAFEPWLKPGKKPLLPLDAVRDMVEDRAPNHVVDTHDVKTLLDKHLGPYKRHGETTLRNYTSLALQMCESTTQHAVHQSEARGNREFQCPVRARDENTVPKLHRNVLSANNKHTQD